MATENTHVAIAGNIGSGKSSLTALLAAKFGWRPAYEIVDTNPYLTDFYQSMDRWSFHLQIFFLTSRFRHQRDLMRMSDPIIQDRTIYEDGEIFARNLFLQGKMEERDYRTYLSHFDTLTEFVRPPTLLIYLRANTETLMKRIHKRARDYEMQIPESYIAQLNDQYEAWITRYQRSPVVTVDVTKQDFVNVPKHLEQVASIVAWELECIKNKSQKELPLSSKARKGRLEAPKDHPQLAL